LTKIIRSTVKDTIKENRKECMLIRRVFHGRIGKRRWEKKIQRQGGKCRGKRLMEWIEENGWEEGEWIHVGSRGETVIVNEEAWERVKG
jgi:hypothetical protein